MAGNLFGWTLEALSNNFRVLRGNSYSYDAGNVGASRRKADSDANKPSTVWSGGGSRVTFF